MAIFNEKEGEMCKEKKYEWCVRNIIIRDIVETACGFDSKDFMVWCFKNSIGLNQIWDVKFKYGIGDKLLNEILKPERKSWLDFAINQGYVKEIENEETFKIGDVIETGCNLKLIINAVSENIVVFNDEFGRRSNNVLSAVDPFKISKKDIECHLAGSIKKVGHGVKYLL
jgi:hypothetical protein